MKNVYEDGTYLARNPDWHESHSEWKAQQIHKLITRNNLNPGTICEIGCGAGEILNQLMVSLNNNIHFAGYEISPQAFKICQAKSKERLSYYLKDLLEEEAFFDIVMAIDVFEHVENHFSFLRKLKTKGEYKVFHIPLDISVASVLSGSWLLTSRYKTGHLHVFTKDTALATLQDTGYEILDFFYTQGSLELPTTNRKQKLLRIPKRLSFPINQNLTVKIFGGFSLLVLTK